MRRGAVVAVVVVALVLRIALMVVTDGYFPQGDAADYDRNAKSLVKEGTYPATFLGAEGSPTAYRPPAYPYALAGVYALSGSKTGAGRLFSVLLGTAAVALIMLVGRELFGPRVGLAAGALAAVFPPLVAISVTLLSENLFIALMLGAVLCAARAMRADPRPALAWAVAAGALTGACALTREVGLAVLVAIVVALVLTRALPRGRRLGSAAVAFAAACVIVAPWTVRNYGAFDAVVPVSTSGGPTLAGTYSPAGRASGSGLAPADAARAAGVLGTSTEPDIDGRLRREALSYARHNPGYVVSVSAGHAADWVRYPREPRAWTDELNLSDTWRPVMGVSTVALVGAAFAALLWPASRALLRRAPATLWLVPLALLALSVPGSGNPRYRLPLDPFLIMAAACLVVAAADRRGKPA